MKTAPPRDPAVESVENQLAQVSSRIAAIELEIAQATPRLEEARQALEFEQLAMRRRYEALNEAKSEIPGLEALVWRAKSDATARPPEPLETSSVMSGHEFEAIVASITKPTKSAATGDLMVAGRRVEGVDRATAQRLALHLERTGWPTRKVFEQHLERVGA